MNPLDLLHRDLRRLLRELALQLETSDAFGGTWSPALDVVASAEALELSAELPGLAPEQIELRIEEGALVLRGHKTVPPPCDSPRLHFHRTERQQGSFERRIPLPRSVDTHRIEARLEGGLLRVILPLLEERRARRRSIEIVEIDEKAPR